MAFVTIKAYYGANDEIAQDVTNIIAGKFGSLNKINFTVSAAALGLSLLPAKARQLSVYYQYTTGGPTMSTAACDGDSFELFNSPSQRVIFNKVTYGGRNMFVDITDKFQQAVWINPANLIFEVGSPTFLNQFIGSDIDLGVRKTLLLVYKWDGKDQEVMLARDGDKVDMNFPPNNLS